MSLRVIKFWTKYTQQPDGSTRPDDWVEYCAVGQAQLATTTASVKSLSRVRPVIDHSDDIAAKVANARWDAIRPLYEAWKAGHEAPIHGTPFAAWPGISPEQAEILRTSGYRTVEELAEASDGALNHIRLPGVREIQANAKRFLGSKDQAKVAAELAKKDAELADMRDELEELKASMAAMRAEQDKPRRGRPPKAHADDETEDAA